MKQSFTRSSAQLTGVRGLPAFSWARQSPIPTWDAAPAGVADRFRAVGTATDTDTDAGQCCAWSYTGPISMGGVSTTLPTDVRIAVLVGGRAPAD